MLNCCQWLCYVQVFSELQHTFKQYEVLLTQFCEEKVQLAQKALDLIAMHQTDLDSVSAHALEPFAAATAHAELLAIPPRSHLMLIREANLLRNHRLVLRPLTDIEEVRLDGDSPLYFRLY
jgi:hypothetical protein